MKILRNVSITRKLNILTILAVSVSLTLCCVAFLVNDIHTLKVAKKKQISALATVLGSNSISAIEFNDPDEAAITLASLVEQPEVEMAMLYDESGELFATYPKGLKAEDIRPANRTFMEVSHEIFLKDSDLEIAEPDLIYADEFASYQVPVDDESETLPIRMVSYRHASLDEGTAIGTLVIRANTNDIKKQMSSRTIVTLGVLIGALVIGVAISQLFQRSITEPIQSLAKSAKYIAKHEDYTHRAEVHGKDELGVLAEAFNQMVAEVQIGREQLQMANDELELRVEVRTEELAKANEYLTNEMKERNALQEELITTSRHAGMAEVATGVLHNVGNVLNSVNVSANLLMDQLKGSRVGSLKKAAEIIIEHQDNLAEFVTHDKRGQHFPKLLEELAANLSDQRDAQLDEITLLLNNIEHVKEIISMQQSYARMRGTAETVDLVELTQDALRIVDTSLNRHGVHVNCQFKDTRTINSEKHKILQILTNLISNAKNALDASDAEDKQITLGIYETDEWVWVVVKDNGIGIPEENLNKIFNHGFTTRKEGHGFGLHSCATAAQELGGSLTVQSKEGEGAKFVLKLPFDHKPSEEGSI